MHLGAEVHLDSVEDEEEERMSHEHRHHRGLVKRSDPTRHASPSPTLAHIPLLDNLLPPHLKLEIDVELVH